MGIILHFFRGCAFLLVCETILNFKRDEYIHLFYFFVLAAFICEGNNNCLNGGFCLYPQNMDGPNDHNCWCEKGYSGRRCEISKCFGNLA